MKKITISSFESSLHQANRWLRLLGLAVGSLFLVPDSGAAVVISHYGANDPTSNGWTLVEQLWTGNSVSPISADGAWQTRDTSTNTNRPSVLYTQSAASYVSAASQGWRLSATVSLEDASKGGVAILAYTNNSNRRFILTLDFDLITGNTRALAWTSTAGNYSYLSADTGATGYITYHMVHNGTSASVYIGDSTTPVITGYMGLDNQSSWKNTVRWGTSNGLQTATLNWKSVEFEVVPEASTALLALSGSGLLAFASMRQRRKNARN